MQPTALRALEFDRVREALAREAATPLGRARAEALTPSTTPEDVRRLLTLTTEARDLQQDGRSLAIDAPDDLPIALEQLDVETHALDPAMLLTLARFFDSIGAVTDSVRLARRFPGLAAIAERAASFDAEAAAVRRAIQPTGEIKDDASPALRDIRDRLRRQRAKLRSTLEALTRNRDTSKYLQDHIITDRHGRYVVVLRAEHVHAIPGIVHGTSGSGASVYLEPLPTVELNNEIVTLVERETEEIQRILLALTDAFRSRPDEFDATVDVATELDELYAKAALARRLNGIAPALSNETRLEFLGARHPLLLLKSSGVVSRDGGETTPEVVSPVANDLLLIAPVSALVISGPNTGGKTVALKAAGLLALMAQSGLLIPVDPASRFSPFASIFADIGDDQSIAASLSTFSAHIANLVEMNRALELPALVLLDEVGGGTDPVEGGALGAAVIDHFKTRGALVIATTHDDALKSYAATTAGVTTAGFGFEPRTYAPTYRLLYGSPGRSLALEIAERLGMPATVVDAARTRRTTRESMLADHLARVDRELAAIERARQTLDKDRAAVRAHSDALALRETQLAEREARAKQRLDEKIGDRLRDARAEIDAVVADLKNKAESLADQAERRSKAARPALSTGEIGGLRAQARSALGTIGRKLEIDPSPQGGPAPLDAAPEIGQTVYVATFAADGIVRGVSSRDADVEVRGKRLRVPLAQLRAASTESVASSDSARGRRSSHVSTPSPVAARELVVIGATVDEAVARVEKFLDAALLADERRLRVVHGHGTGRLRDALRAFFREHPLVASVAPAPDNEGGGGATIVELKE